MKRLVSFCLLLAVVTAVGCAVETTEIPPTFNQGDVVQHKLSKKIYMVDNSAWNSEHGEYQYFVSDGSDTDAFFGHALELRPCVSDAVYRVGTEKKWRGRKVVILDRSYSPQGDTWKYDVRYNEGNDWYVAVAMEVELEPLDEPQTDAVAEGPGTAVELREALIEAGVPTIVIDASKRAVEQPADEPVIDEPIEPKGKLDEPAIESVPKPEPADKPVIE